MKPRQLCRVRFRPYYAKRKINRYVRLVAENRRAYFFEETDAAGRPKTAYDKRNDRIVKSYITLLKADAELLPA